MLCVIGRPLFSLLFKLFRFNTARKLIWYIWCNENAIELSEKNLIFI
jgi:hypothetical protein